MLAHVSFKLGAFEDAATLFKRALELRPDAPRRHQETLIGWLARATAAAGHEHEARVLLDRLDHMNLELFKEYTKYNYSRIVDLLREHNITVIAMQYPTLSIEALRKLLDNRDDVIYLENRDTFEQALRDEPYAAVFYDSFAGSFGHCTDTGNQLIADNVAQTINDFLVLRKADNRRAETQPR